MKILHIEDRIHPEMGYQVNFIARYHNPAHELLILTTGSFSLWKNSNKDEIISKSDKDFELKNYVKIIRNNAMLDRKGKNNLWIKGLIKSIKTIDPDIIYTHGIETFTTMRILRHKSLLKNYIIVTDTHTLLNQFQHNLKFRLYIFLLKIFVIKKINRYKIPVFFTTDENREIALKYYGVNEENIFPFTIGTDFSEYYFSLGKRTEIRNKLNISDNEILILYAGKINELKQPHLILEALKTIETKIDSLISILFIGAKDENYYGKYFNIKFNSGRIRIHISEPVKSSELYQYYSAADFAVFPKQNTLSSLDVQACRLPLIMEDDRTNAKRLKDGGLLYQQNNIIDLGEKMSEFINDKSLREELGKNGYNYVMANYDYKQIINSMEKVLESLYLRKYK